MSRTYRHNVETSDANSRKYFKRLANKRVRKSDVIIDGKSYRKLLCPWEIRGDYVYTNEANKIIKEGQFDSPISYREKHKEKIGLGRIFSEICNAEVADLDD